MDLILPEKYNMIQNFNISLFYRLLVINCIKYKLDKKSTVESNYAKCKIMVDTSIVKVLVTCNNCNLYQDHLSQNYKFFILPKQKVRDESIN